MFKEVGRLLSGPIADAGTSVDESDDVRMTPLMLAASSGSTAVVDSLIDAGANVNAKSASGHSPLMLAAKYGHVTALMRLLGFGADGTPVPLAVLPPL